MAISFTWTEVLALAPELARVSVDGQNEVITMVLQEINSSAWGSDEKGKTAALWLARHIGSVFGRGGTGIVTEVHAGAVGKSFAQPPADWKSLLSTTMYGQQYLRLVRLRMPRFAVT